MANATYRDIGALQHKDGSSPTAQTTYADIGALQHADSAAAVFIAPKPYLVKQAVNRASTY